MIRCEHNINPDKVYRDEHRTSKFVHTAFILIVPFSFYNSSSSFLLEIIN